jgi:hypothetical protein
MELKVEDWAIFIAEVWIMSLMISPHTHIMTAEHSIKQRSLFKRLHQIGLPIQLSEAFISRPNSNYQKNRRRLCDSWQLINAVSSLIVLEKERAIRVAI